MSVQVPVEDLTRILELLTLYSHKGSFNLDEYIGVGTAFKNISEAKAAVKDETEVALKKEDVACVLNSISILSVRPPREGMGGPGVQNYKPIALLFETLRDILKASEEEETKESA